MNITDSLQFFLTLLFLWLIYWLCKILTSMKILAFPFSSSLLSLFFHQHSWLPNHYIQNMVPVPIYNLSQINHSRSSQIFHLFIFLFAFKCSCPCWALPVPSNQNLKVGQNKGFIACSTEIHINTVVYCLI